MSHITYKGKMVFLSLICVANYTKISIQKCRRYTGIWKVWNLIDPNLHQYHIIIIEEQHTYIYIEISDAVRICCVKSALDFETMQIAIYMQCYVDNVPYMNSTARYLHIHDAISQSALHACRPPRWVDCICIYRMRAFDVRRLLWFHCFLEYLVHMFKFYLADAFNGSVT